jgi:ArsR family transcriptional regulator
VPPCCPSTQAAIPPCPPILVEPLDGRDAVELAGRLKVLSDPGRLRLLGLIKAQPRGEACVCNLTSALGLSQPTVTHHLQVLHRAGFLARERRGVWVWYRVVPRALAAIRRALA